MNTKIIKLDINNKMYETITAKQGDTESRFLLFHLFDASLPFDLTEKSVRVYGIKPDGTKIFNDLVINDVKKGYCTLKLTNQMLAIAGLVKLELVIYSGNKKLSSIPFMLNVISSLNSDDAVVSTNEFTSLMNGLAALSEYDIYKSNAKQVPGIKEEVSNLSSQLDTKAKQVDLEVERKRIDCFTKLADGSTTGDAELIDGRVGCDGITYDNIGSAIRSQFSNVNNEIDKLFVPSINIFNSALYDKKSLAGINITYDSNTGYLTIDGACTGVGAFWNDFILNITDNITVSIRYISGNISGNGIQFDLYNTDSVGTPIGTATSSFCTTGSVLSKTLSNINLKQSRIYVKNGTVCNNLVIAIQAEKGVTVSAFEKNGYKTENFLDKSYSEKINKVYDNYFITDVKQDLGYFQKGGVVICVDDGTEYDKGVAWELIKEFNVPFVFALMQDCYVVKNQLEELKQVVSTYKCEVALHGGATMSDWTIKNINDFYANEINKFNEQGIDINNFVAPQNETSINMRYVGQNYFDMMFSEFPNKNGVTIENKNRTNRYKLTRTSVTPSYGTGYFFPRMLRTKTEPLLLVMYFHSVDMANKSDYLQLIRDILQYAKDNSIEITTFNKFFNSN